MKNHPWRAVATSQQKDKQAARYTRQKVRGRWAGARFQRVQGSLCEWKTEGGKGVAAAAGVGVGTASNHTEGRVGGASSGGQFLIVNHQFLQHNCQQQPKP